MSTGATSQRPSTDPDPFAVGLARAGNHERAYCRDMRPGRLLATLSVAVLCATLAACGGSGDPGQGGTSPSDGTAADASPSGDCPSVPPPSSDGPFDQALHDELVAMLERDQAGRTGGDDAEGDQARTDRLQEIVAEHGWPGYALVGEDGEEAAWAIAQHSDLDPDAQRCALRQLEAAVEAGQASPGNLAYLSDRVAAAAGEPQTYGTQMGCGPDGPEPATPLVDPDRVDELRAEAGLPSYADYLDEMTAVCAEDG